MGSEAPVALPRWQNCEQFCEQHGYKVFGDVITTSKKVAWHFEMFFCAVCFQLEKRALPLNFMGIWQAASDEGRNFGLIMTRQDDSEDVQRKVSLGNLAKQDGG